MQISFQLVVDQATISIFLLVVFPWWQIVHWHIGAAIIRQCRCGQLLGCALCLQALTTFLHQGWECQRAC